MTDTPVTGTASGNDTAEKSLPPEESGRRGAPRLREIMRRQRRDSDVSNSLIFQFSPLNIVASKIITSNFKIFSL